MIRAALYGIALMLAFGHMGLASEIDAIEQDSAEKELRVKRALVEVEPPRFQLQTHPTKSPRCPRINAAGEPLLYSFAQKADREEWRHECHYGIRT